jgi:hypothetical protein
MTVGDIKSGSPARWHRAQVALYIEARPLPGLVFDEAEHRYWLNGEEYPSVTRIVGPKGRSYYAPGSAERGQSVHTVCALDARGVLEDALVPEHLLPYLAAWRDFRNRYHPVFSATEQRRVNPNAGYAGTCDLVMDLGEPPTVKQGVLIYLDCATRKAKLDFICGMDLVVETANGMRAVSEYRRGVWHGA